MSDFEQDRALDVLLEDAVTEAEDEAPRPRPSFANVVARAHAIDRKAVPAESVRRAIARSQDEAFVAPPESAGPHDDIEVFLTAAREEAQADIARRQSMGTPPWRAKPGRTRRLGLVVASIAAIAAAFVLTLGPIGLRRDASRVDAEALQAQASELGETGLSEAIEGAPEPPRPKRRARTPATRDTAPVVEPPQPEQDAAPPPQEEPTPRPKPQRRPPLGERLETLDARAEQALARGDVGEADALYRQIISVGGRHPRAELAYGERFTIAHRQRKSGKQRKLYRAYLRAFPRGRFVDDARAGLCRTASETERASCWARYLGDRPKGAYASEAKRWSERTEASP